MSSDLTMLCAMAIPVHTSYVVGWGTLALINAGLAQGKDRSGFGWFCTSLFLGPVATFLIVILDPVPVSNPAAGGPCQPFSRAASERTSLESVIGWLFSGG